jgi:tetratricopeptide (TPR) repeat protein
MAKKETRATLGDKQARGGVIGGKGYGFQAAYIVSHIPLWLADPDFAMFLQEGAGDVDVRFDRESGEERWYVQVKNYLVKPTTAREVFTQFREADEGSPGTYTRFTLACPGLHDKLKQLRAAVEDLRGARPFYRPGQDPILDNTWADLEKLVGKLKLPVDAAFLVDKAHFDTDLAGLADDTSLCDLFVGRLLKLELWSGVPPAAVADAYETLALRAHREIRRTCERDRTEATIRDAVAEFLAKAVQLEGIPSPPTPYYAYRYPMPENWTGRRGEMDALDVWLADDDMPLCCLIAIGGMGKSSLAWAWLRRRVVAQQEALGLSGIFQCSFYEGEVGFRRFLDDLCTYLGVSAASDPVTALTQRLAEERVLLVLDGFERLLCAYAAVDAALLPERPAEELEPSERRCADLSTARFLRALVADAACKTLLTSRLVPQELDKLGGWQLMELPGLASDDAVAYLRDCGIQGTRRELQDAAAVYDYHPLSLSKLVEVLNYDLYQPDDVRQAPRYDVALDLKARHDHVLERAYETLPEDLARFLSQLAALRGKATMDVVRFLAGDWTEAELSASLRRLEEDRWVTWDRVQETLDFHPVVRRYAYGRLEDKFGTHTHLVEYFRQVTDEMMPEELRTIPPQVRALLGAGTGPKAESLDDLAPVIELYHHTVRAGRYDEAVRLLRDRLVPDPLHFRFGAYQLMIELKRTLFPSSEPLAPSGQAALPLLSDESAQTWTLNALANSYAFSGQPARAVPLFEAFVSMHEGGVEEPGPYAVDEWKGDFAIGLGNLAIQQLAIGALAVAEESLRRSIALCREIGDEGQEATGQYGLGRVLSYEGQFEEAEEQFAIAFDTKQDHRQAQGIIWSYRALRGLLMGDADGALEAARRARELALAGDPNIGGAIVTRDVIRAEWLLGAALRARGELAQAEPHLDEALRRCRRINLVEVEADILLELARVGARHALSLPEALSLAQEALSIADRCGYRLQQAGCHNFLARLALDAGNPDEARQHAETARERAECDGPGHRYEIAYQEAERLLEQIADSK